MASTLKLTVTAIGAALLLSSPWPVWGYALEGAKWPGPTIPVVVQMGTPSFVLPDGFTSWNSDVENALAQWNEQIRNAQFTWTEQPPGPNQAGVTQIQFSSNAYSYSFGTDVLAVTLLNRSGGTMTETDVLFNNRIAWTSSGTVSPKLDLHRVALHEFGHVLGLDHPDQNHPGVGYVAPKVPPPAIMVSNVGALNTLTADDVAGVQSLYGAPIVRVPVTGAARLSNLSTRGHVGTGSGVLIPGFIVHDQTKPLLLRALGPTLAAYHVAGSLPDPVLELHNQNGTIIFSNDNWTDTQGPAILSTGLAPADSNESAIRIDLAPGNYTTVISGKSGSTGMALAEVYDLSPPTGRTYDISTRGQVGGSAGPLIAGFIVRGPQLKKVIIRAIGPGLASLLSGYVPNTRLELHNAQGQLMATNSGWQSDLLSSYVSYYQLPPPSPNDSALYAQLAPGSYTAIFSSPTNASGIGLVEVYDLDR